MKDNRRGEHKKYFENPGFMGILGERLEYKLPSPFYRAYVREFGLKGNEKVLDFGCGGGSCARHLARALRKNGSLTCVDTSKFWLARAEKRMKEYSRLEFNLGDIKTLDIEDAAGGNPGFNGCRQT